jgi:large subunit ribosomal protein L18
MKGRSTGDFMSTHTTKSQRIARSRAAVHGTYSRPRLVVERTADHFRAQLVDDQRGHTLAAASDGVTTKGLRGTPQAEAVGTELAEAAKKIGVTSAVLDRRGHRYHGRVKAFAEAARAAGLKI